MRQLCTSVLLLSLVQPLYGMIEEKSSSRYEDVREVILNSNLNTLHEWFTQSSDEGKKYIAAERKLYKESALLPFLFVADWQKNEKGENRDWPVSLAKYTLETTDGDLINEFFKQPLKRLISIIECTTAMGRVTRIPKLLVFHDEILEKDLETIYQLCKQFYEANSKEITISKELWEETKTLPQEYILDNFVIPRGNMGDENLYVKVLSTPWENIVSLGGAALGEGFSTARGSVRDCLQAAVGGMIISKTPWALETTPSAFPDFYTILRTGLIGFLRGSLGTVYMQSGSIIRPGPLVPSTAIRYVNKPEKRDGPLLG